MEPAASMALVVGNKVEYYSTSKKCWMPVTIVFVDEETKAVELDVKANMLIELQDQSTRLRPLTKPSQAQLDWVWSVLREGRLEEESQRVFGRHARPVTALQDSLCHFKWAAPRAMVIREEDMYTVGAELDEKLGVCGAVCALGRQFEHVAGRALTREYFDEVFWQLIWRTHREFCQAFSRDDAASRRGVDPRQVYEFEHMLGEGAFGSVMLAREKSSGASRAVKIINKKDKKWAPTYQLDCEIDHLCLLDHPHVVKLYEHYEDFDCIYLVMDYCSGGDLHGMVSETRRRQGSIPEDFVSGVMRQILMAIAHVHSRGVVHLDLKTENIMLMPSRGTMPPSRALPKPAAVLAEGKPHVMIIDLGIAQILQPSGGQPSTPMGTPKTMAPEVWKGVITPKADIFSCGVVLFELLCCDSPFSCPYAESEAADYWSSHPDVPWTSVQNSSPEAVALCRQMLLINRHSRPTASQCLLAPFLQGSGSAAPDQTSPEAVLRLAGVHRRSVLYKSVALAIARVWPANQLPTIRRLFAELDTTGAGVLNVTQVSAALKRYGVEAGRAGEAADAMDLSRDGTIQWTEFVAACIHLDDGAYDEDLERIFRRADKDGDGLLNQLEISSLLAVDHLRGTACRDVFVDLTGRTDEGARVDWPTFRAYFRAESHGGGAGAAPAAGQLLRQACAWFEQLRDAFWPNRAEGAEPPEAMLEQLASMGFTDREQCVKVLKKHRIYLTSEIVEELLGSQGAR